MKIATRNHRICRLNNKPRYALEIMTNGTWFIESYHSNIFTAFLSFTYSLLTTGNQ